MDVKSAVIEDAIIDSYEEALLSGLSDFLPVENLVSCEPDLVLMSNEVEHCSQCADELMIVEWIRLCFQNHELDDRKLKIYSPGEGIVGYYEELSFSELAVVRIVNFQFKLILT